jgi:hypothetical protein
LGDFAVEIEPQSVRDFLRQDPFPLLNCEWLDKLAQRKSPNDRSPCSKISSCSIGAGHGVRVNRKRRRVLRLKSPLQVPGEGNARGFIDLSSQGFAASAWRPGAAWDGSSVGFGMRRRPLPAAPTLAWPGSVEKVAVLCQPARDRVQLWHPDDAAFTLAAWDAA